MVQTSLFLKKLTISILDLPYEFNKILGETLLASVENGRLEYINRHNIKLLLTGQTEVLEIHKTP